MIFIDRGDRVKINNISFEGNNEFSDGALRKQFKNTKRKFFGHGKNQNSLKTITLRTWAPLLITTKKKGIVMLE